MSATFSLNFRSPPSIVPSYARILFGRKLPVVPDGVTVPRLEATAARFRPSRARVDAYRQVCGHAPSEFLPVAYPHILVTPVQLALLSSNAFPVRLMGLVHLRNHIEQLRPLRIDEEGQIRTWVDGRHDTDRGQEFDVFTEITVRGERVWAETCVFMARRLERDTSKPFGARISAGEGVPAPDAEAVQPASPDAVRKLSVDCGQGHRLALRARVERLQSDSSLQLRREAVRLQSADRARHVVDGAVSRGDARRRVRFTVSRGRGVQAARVAPAPLTLESWRTPEGDGFALKGAVGKGKVHLAGSITPLQRALCPRARTERTFTGHRSFIALARGARRAMATRRRGGDLFPAALWLLHASLAARSDGARGRARKHSHSLHALVRRDARDPAAVLVGRRARSSTRRLLACVYLPIVALFAIIATAASGGHVPPTLAAVYFVSVDGAESVHGLGVLERDGRFVATGSAQRLFGMVAGGGSVGALRRPRIQCILRGAARCNVR